MIRARGRRWFLLSGITAAALCVGFVAGTATTRSDELGAAEPPQLDSSAPGACENLAALASGVAAGELPMDDEYVLTGVFSSAGTDEPRTTMQALLDACVPEAD